MLLDTYSNISGKEDIYYKGIFAPTDLKQDFNSDFGADFAKTVPAPIIIFIPDYEQNVWLHSGHEEILGYTIQYNGLEYSGLIIIEA